MTWQRKTSVTLVKQGGGIEVTIHLLNLYKGERVFIFPYFENLKQFLEREAVRFLEREVAVNSEFLSSLILATCVPFG